MFLQLLAKRTLLAASSGALAFILAQPLTAQDKPAAKPIAGKAAGGHPATKEPKENEMGHIHYLDYKNGFRGVKFGSPQSAIPGIELVKESGAMKVYKKNDEVLTIGACQLDKIYYHFLNGKFMAVSLFAKEVEDGIALRSIFEIAYGNGIPNKPHADSSAHRSHADEFFWKGKVANARISFSESHQGEAWIGNNELQEQYGKIQKKSAEEAAASLFF